MKTPEEIKKGLGSCSADECHGDHTDCHYIDNVLCIRAICGDALAYIQQLEAKVTNLERVRATQATSVTTMQDALFKQQLHQSRLLEERSQLEARVPRWIPVEERLPERGVFVVVYYGNFIGNLMDVYMWDGECWRSSTGYLEDAENITHWMELPEPPEEVQKNAD